MTTPAPQPWPVNDDALVAPGELEAAHRLLWRFRSARAAVGVGAFYVAVAVAGPGVVHIAKAYREGVQCRETLRAVASFSVQGAPEGAVVHSGGAGGTVVAKDGVYVLFVDGAVVAASDRCATNTTDVLSGRQAVGMSRR